MRIVKCDSGHYYDADVYKECPHCTGKSDYKDIITSLIMNGGIDLRADDISADRLNYEHQV